MLEFIKLNNQAIEALDNLLLNYRFIIENNSIVFFWQPFTDKEEEGRTIEDRLELILEHGGIEVDSHCLVSPGKNFADAISWYKQRNIITYNCIKCDTKRDFAFNADDSIPSLIKNNCQICEADMVLKDKNI